MKNAVLIFLVFSSFTALFAQKGRDETLANSYFNNGEYEKAIDILVPLWEKNNQANQFYTLLFQSYLNVKKLEDAEKLAKKQSKKFAENVQYQIDLGYVFTRKSDPQKAKEIYEKVIKSIRPSDTEIRATAQSFTVYKELDWVILVYEKGEKMFKGNIDYSQEIAAAYTAQTNYAKAAERYLQSIEKMPATTQDIKNKLQTAQGGDKVMSAMETLLYGRLQKNPDNENYLEFLAWIYIQNKDFEGAILQMKALDKRKNGNGQNVLVIARMAQSEGAYAEAIKGYEYVANKSPKSVLYFQAKTELLNCRKEKIAKTINYTKEDLTALKMEYESFISENGKNVQTAQSIKELAELEGFYLDDVKTAIETAEELISIPGISQNLKNQTKLVLGDFYVIAGDVWESSLLYSQVDKEEKDSPLGEEARFKNAQLSYFKGDFDWAQEQLTVLKSATSELIANDAINLSAFIIDNLGMDTTSEAMERFSKAELLQFQHKDDEALTALDSIVALFPGHDLYDDIAFAKAQIFVKKRKFTDAVPLLEHIIKDYGKDIKGDDAVFLLAEINEKELGNKEKAKELYKKVITEYSNSLLVIEARKRFRALRGDKLQETN